MVNKIKTLIDNKDYEGIRQLLANNPQVANEGIPYGEDNLSTAHPLHRICDGVFSKKYTDEEAVEIAKLFLEYGANINGNAMVEKKDTLLVAAASLGADKVAIFYIDKGADVNHRGCHGGTALHWAAWCGRDNLVQRLVNEVDNVNKLCIDYKSTPLFWAVHGLKFGEGKEIKNYVACVKILLLAGADKSIPNCEGHTVFDLLGKTDIEVREALS